MMHCPICRAPMVFDPEDQMWVCAEQIMELVPHKDRSILQKPDSKEGLRD